VKTVVEPLASFANMISAKNVQLRCKWHSLWCMNVNGDLEGNHNCRGYVGMCNWRS
jgi:hypothetical protein